MEKIYKKEEAKRKIERERAKNKQKKHEEKIKKLEELQKNYVSKKLKKFRRQIKEK